MATVIPDPCPPTLQGSTIGKYISYQFICFNKWMLGDRLMVFNATFNIISVIS